MLVWATLSTDRTPWLAFALLSFAIATHLSHFPIYGVLLFVGLGARLARDPSVRSWHRAGPLVLRAGGPLAIAMLIVMHYAAVGGAMLALLWCLPRMGRPEDRPFRILVATVFLGVVANAGLAATLSTVHPRYESRVIWLVVLAGGVAALQLVDERRRRRPLADGVHGSSRPGTL